MKTTLSTLRRLGLAASISATILLTAASPYQGPRNIPQVTVESNGAFIPKTLEELHSVMVRLTVKDGNPLCTATYISAELLLTAAHCVLDRDMVTPNLAYLNSEALETLVADGPRDVAILRTTKQLSKRFMGLEARTANILFKPQFVACGYGAGVMMCSNPGMFYPENMVDLSIYNVTSNIGPVMGGMSGGPVFDLETGKIVGIVQGGFTGGMLMGTGIFTPIPVILDVLERVQARLAHAEGR